MSDTVVITVAVDTSLIAKSGAIQWPGIRKPLQTATPTPSADGIESMMFTYRFMEDQPTVFTDDVQASEAESCAGDRACTDMELSAVNVPQTDEGRTTDDCVRTADREVDVCAREGSGHAADVCPEAQLMAGGNSVVYVEDEGPVARLLRWVAGICGDFAVHASPEAQLMADNPAIYQNGLVQWLLR